MFGRTTSNDAFSSSVAAGFSSLAEQRGLRGCVLSNQVPVYLFCHRYGLSPMYVLGSVLGTDEPAIPLLSSVRHLLGHQQGQTIQNPTSTRGRYQSLTRAVAITVLAHKK